MSYTLGKDEKLKSKTAISQLFTAGIRIKSFPLQLIYLEMKHSSQIPIKVAFSVPKRTIKLAVNRNSIKRLMREVYRTNKQCFTKNINKQYVFMFIYMANKELSFKDLEESILKLSDQFLIKIKNNE
jgi:ribonuclease P protein component